MPAFHQVIILKVSMVERRKRERDKGVQDGLGESYGRVVKEKGKKEGKRTGKERKKHVVCNIYFSLTPSLLQTDENPAPIILFYTMNKFQIQGCF